MISYNDSEVDVYHPICENALNIALRFLGRIQIIELFTIATPVLWRWILLLKISQLISISL